jgi:plastocyanin
MIKTATAIIVSVLCAVSYQALGDEFEMKSLNRSFTGFFVFSPDFVQIKPGDAINFVAVGVVVVGDPANIDKIDPSTLPGKARTKLDTLLEPLKKS